MFFILFQELIKTQKRKLVVGKNAFSINSRFFHSYFFPKRQTLSFSMVDIILALKTSSIDQILLLQTYKMIKDHFIFTDGKI